MALLCRDANYAAKLIDYFNNTEGFIFSTTAFTSMEAYISYCAENEVELLLCEEILYNADFDKTAEMILLFTENITVCKENQMMRIFKFQSAYDIMQDIMQIYLKRTPGYTDVSVENAGIYTVISPSGGNRCSVTAAVMAGVMAKFERTILLSFDPFFSDSRLEIYGEEKNISEAVHYAAGVIKDGKKEISMTVSRNEYFSYITGCTHWADFTEILLEEAEVIIRGVLSLGFKSIIIDAGGFYRCTSAILMWSRKIFVPFYGSVSEKEKEQEWLRHCNLNGSIQESKIVHIRPPFEKNISDGNYNMKELIDGTLGNYIKDIFNQCSIRSAPEV